VADFSACYARELSSLTWFVMSLGATALYFQDFCSCVSGS
jgi:hypothetical protein